MTENLRIGDVIYIFVDPPLMVQPLLMKLTVGYLGAESFIVEGYKHMTDGEYYYDDINISWYKTLGAARKSIREQFGSKTKIQWYKTGNWSIHVRE